MPIGNLTSQIFANIYFNEFDRFVKHNLKPKAYLRYGDDFIIIEKDREKLKAFRASAIRFLRDKLKLELNSKLNKILKVRHGLKFLGVILWPHGHKLNKRNVGRVREKLTLNNVGSYYGVMKHHTSYKRMREFCWFTSVLVSPPQFFSPHRQE